MTEVAAALIRQNDRFMICRRPPYKARGGLYEFVGGKQEPGESLWATLIRECKEELDVQIAVDDIFMEVTHEYSDLTVHLTLFNARIVEGEPKLLEHTDIRWITPEEIDDYEFCPADEKILAALKAKRCPK